MNVTTGPFAKHALTYLAAGWPVLPLGHRQKKTPPTGYTGADGIDADHDTVDQWVTEHPDGNIGIRAPDNVVGIDVDAYDTKPGWDTWNDLRNRLGEPPRTWTSTSRDDGKSGIRFYRLATPTRLIGSLPGIEIVQRHHRYAVVWPSIHPDHGRTYQWITPDGEPADAPPRVDELPILPTVWLNELRYDNKTTHQRHRAATGLGDTHPSVDKQLGKLARELTAGTRHDTGLRVVTALTRLAAQGYPGADRALDDARRMWLQAVGDSRTDREADAEWDRMVTSAADEVSRTASTIPPYEPWQPDRGFDGLIDGDQLGAPAAKSTTDEPWDPQPFIETHEAPSFPLEALPYWCVDHIRAVAEAIQTPVDAPATFTIGALSAVATGRLVVAISDRWASEPVNLYLALVMRSGAGKSPVEKTTARWARRWVARRVDEQRDNHDKAAMKARALRKKADAAEQSLETGRIDTDEAWEAHIAARLAEEAVEPLPYLFVDDATPEAVTTNLKAFRERQAVISTEADLFDMVTGDARRRPNINVYLRAWSGDTLTRHRKGGDAGPEATELEHPLMSICCAVQPVVLDRIAKDPELVKRGFVPRFMISVPDDLMGRRDHRTKLAPGGIDTQTAYDSTATALADKWARYETPAIIRVGRPAAELLIGWMNQLEPELGPEGTYPHLAEWAAKCTASVARYAGLLWAAEGQDLAAPLDETTMARAIEMGEYWVGHAHAAYATAADVVAVQALAILETIAEHGWPAFPLSDLQRRCRRPGIDLVKAADYVPAVRRLVDNGWIRPLDSAGWEAGLGSGRKSPRFDAWPGLTESNWRERSSRVSRVARKEDAKTLSLHISNSTPTLRATRDARDDPDPPPEAPEPVDNPPIDPFAPLDNLEDL